MTPLRFIAGLLLAFTLFRVDSAFADATIIHAGQLMAVPGQPIEGEKSIVVENGIITQIYNGYVRPEDLSLEGEVNVIYLGDMFVLPGLIDSHVHLSGEIGPRRALQRMQERTTETTMKGLMFARRTLEAGFTTVRDAGAPPDMIFGLRDGIDKGYVQGPRIIASGSGVSATGSHADIDGYRPEILELFTSNTICDGPYDCRRAVREAVKYGADYIKITATGGVLSDTNTGVAKQLTDDELQEIMDTAHALGRKVAAHAHGADGINAALRAGVDSIEHGTYMDDESVALFLSGGAYYVPTALAGETVVDMAMNTNIFPPNIREKAIEVGSVMRDALGRAHLAGVKIAFGTDSGVSKHGENAQEFLLLVRAGLSPEEAIVTATVNAADLLGLSDEIGTIEIGKAADIIAVDGSPLLDIEQLLDVGFVMKGGDVIKE